MKTYSATPVQCRAGIATVLLWLLVSGGAAQATDYLFNATSGTSAWSTSTVWTPSGIPTTGDNIDYAVNGASSVNLTVGGVARTINNLTKTGTQRWDIIGQSATLSTLNVQTMTIATNNMAFRDGSSGGGLQVNLGAINVSAGTVFFGTTSLSTSNTLRGVAVSGSTTVSGGALQINVNNATDSYSLGLLSVSGTGLVSLNNAPTGKGNSTGSVTGLNGAAGFIQTAPAVAQNGNTSTLAITNTSDYTSGTILRDAANTSMGTTLSLTKAGTGIQTLSGASTFTGSTTVTNGILKLGNVSALGARTGISSTNTDTGTNISSTGTLDLGGQTGVIEVIRLNGTGFGGAGALINSGTAASIGSGVASITQTTAGATAPTLTLSGGGGTGATAALSMGVTSTTFTINGGTTIYSVAPTVTISGGGATTTATATANLTGGVVTSVTIATLGAGYTSAPNIAFSGGTVTTAGTNPTGTGNATNFTPIGYSISNVGSGYTSAPTVSFSSGTFAATTTLSGIVLEGDSSIGGSGDITVDGMIGESGGSRILTKVGANVLTLTNLGNSYTGGTIINGGTLSIAADAALGTAPGVPTPAHLTLDGGTLATTADITLNANRGISLGASGGTVDVASATTLSYGGIIADGGGLTKSGAGTLALSGGNTYTGATLINAGVLAASHSTSLGSAAGGATVASGATLQLAGGITVGAETLSLTGDGAVAGVGALQNLSGNNTWAGGITITAGATRINADAGSLLISGDVAMNGTTGNFNIGGNGDIEISGVISGGLQIFKSSVGGGTVTFSNPNNTYTNHTTVAAGTLKISTESNLGITPASFSSVKLRVRSGGTLQTTADMSISANRGITISNGGGAISPDTGTTLTVNSRISGTATDILSKTGGGTLNLAAESTYAGLTQVNAGTLMVTNTTGSATGSGAVSVITGTLAGNHTGAGNIAGAVTIGTGAILSPGSDTASATHGVGTLKFTAVDLQNGSTGHLNIEGPSTLDRIVVSATNGLTLNGRLSISTSLTGPAFDTAFAEGASFDLLDWAGVIGGTFEVGANFRDGSDDDASQLDLPNLASLGRSWDVSQFLTNGTLWVSVVPEPSRLVLFTLGLTLIFTTRRRPKAPHRAITRCGTGDRTRTCTSFPTRS